MLTNFSSMTMIPVQNTQRAINFYVDILGYELQKGSIEDIVPLKDKHGGQIMLYKRPKSTADHTIMSLVVENFEDSILDLQKAGVSFEKYDMPEVTWDDELPFTIMETDLGSVKSAWFKDSEGNILGLNNNID